MSAKAYPTGVESHGGSLRIWFMYKGARTRESLGVPDTPKNRKIAGELRASVCFAIKTGSFNYAAQFPDSPNLKKLGLEKKEIRVAELAEKWLQLKKMEITTNAFGRYCSVVIGSDVSSNHLIKEFTRTNSEFIRFSFYFLCP